MPDNTISLLRYLLIAVCLITAFAWVDYFVDDTPVITDISVVLPESPERTIETRVQENLQAAYGEKIVLALFGKEQKALEQALRVVRVHVAQSNVIDLKMPGDDISEELVERLAAHRSVLLSADDADRIRNQDYDAFQQEVKRYLHGFPAGLRWLPFSEDPYNLFGHFIESAVDVPDLAVYENYMVGSEGSVQVYLLILEPAGGSFSVNTQPLILDEFRRINEAVAANTPDIEVVTSGAFFHIAEATQRSRSEILIISTASVGLVLFIFLFTFNRIRPLLFSLASILFGFLVSAGITSLLFGQIHVLTLVFGTSLIGLSIDYAFHFLCMGDPQYLSRLRRSSLIALTSTTIAYGLLGVSAISVLNQVAVFAVIGLGSCWLFVMVIYPVLFGAPEIIKSNAMFNAATFMSNIWNRWSPRTFVITVVVFSIAGGIISFSMATTTKRLNSMYKPDAELIENDKRVTDVLGQYSPNQFYVVSGNSVQAVLEDLESMKPELAKLERSGAISGYQLLSDILPSRKTQLDNHVLIRQVYGENGQVFSAIDLSDMARGRLRQAVASPDLLTGADVIDAAGLLSHLWPGQVGGSFVATVPLKGVQSLEALQNARLPESAMFVNLVENWAEALQKELISASLILLVSVGLIGAGLVFWFQAWPALLIAYVPVTSAVLVIALLSLAGYEISLFHVFGLYLIVGLGLDYGIFIYRNTSDDDRCYVAVLLSAGTTIFTFGLLSQSATPMISSFGTTILFGTLLNVLLASGIRGFHKYAN
ncbi:MAG: hypothetical protein WD356_10795 [Pseudomonadales bacterium]